MLIDARGQGCPKPVMMADEALGKMQEGVVDVLIDNEDSALNVSGFAARSGMFTETTREGRDWKVKIVKGYACTPREEYGVRSAEAKKSLLLVIGTDTMGKDEELGRVLMKGFLETMKLYKQLPHTLFFLNAGVRLTTVNPDTVPLLGEIERMGVEIYSCGTCLKQYDLEGRLAVGRRGVTNQIVEGLQEFEKVVWV